MKETLLNKPATQLFLSLLKASLWELPIEIQKFKAAAENAEEERGIPSCTEADWDSIAVMALNQTVGPAVFKSAMTLPSDLLPPKEWMRKAYSFLERNRRTHQLADSCVAEAVELLKKSGINPVLLKGQAYARFYPDSSLRQCGDIDLYVGEKNYYKAYHMACCSGWESKEEFLPNGKHYGCMLRGVRIELHRMAAVLVSRNANRMFQQWSMGQLEKSDCKIVIGNEEITVPKPLFDTVFVFLHLYHHFIFGGIGLRQVADWVMILHAHYAETDRRMLAEVLTHLRLIRAWKLFTPIAVNYLGLPASECPFYSAKHLNMSRRILSLILKEGNFGRGRGRSNDYLLTKNYYLRKLHLLRHFTAMMLPRFSIDPRRCAEVYLRTLSRGATGTILHMLKR